MVQALQDRLEVQHSIACLGLIPTRKKHSAPFAGVEWCTCCGMRRVIEHGTIRRHCTRHLDEKALTYAETQAGVGPCHQQNRARHPVESGVAATCYASGSWPAP